MLSAFFDDSGAGSKIPRLAVIGGYVAEANKAIALQEDWKWRFDLDGVKSFHMADFESCLGEYVGWQKDELAKCKRRFHIESLTYFLKLRSFQYVGAGTLVDVFDQVVSERLNSDEKTRLGGPHAFCFQVCLIELSNWIQANQPAETVDVFFEAGTKLGSELGRLYASSSTMEALKDKFKINQITPVTKDRSIGVLAADLVAYEMFKYHFNRIVEPERPLRKSAEAVLAGKESQGKFFNDPRGINQYLDILEKSGVLKGDYEQRFKPEVEEAP